jgi:hypothetical protein
MDDIALFDDDPAVLRADFQRIQQLLGNFGLNINPSKTEFDRSAEDVKLALSDIQKSLKEIVTEYEMIPTASGVEVWEQDVEVENNLSADQVESLISLLQNEALEEADADLILGFLRTHSDDLLAHLPMLFRRFPNLIKHIHSICADVTAKNKLAKVIFNYLKEGAEFLEYQLFWIAAIVEDYLIGHGQYGDILLRLYELTPDMKIARAKVLEIPEQGFGLKEIRGEYLKTGQSDWLSWSSAVGSQTLKPAERNHVLSYFAKASAMNFLVAECVKKCP